VYDQFVTIIALGTGGFFSLLGWQTNFAIRSGGKHLLIDAGGDVRHSLKQRGISPLSVSGVFVSHLHGDHIGGLDYLGYYHYFFRLSQLQRGEPKVSEKPQLFGEKAMIERLWEHGLKAGMEKLQHGEASLETYFDVTSFDERVGFTWRDTRFWVIRLPHVTEHDSFGLEFDYWGRRTVFTTDVQFNQESLVRLMPLYERAHTIFQDCDTGTQNEVHAHYDQLRTLPPEIRKKMRLTHYGDNVLESLDEWQGKAKKDGFCGFVLPGEIDLKT
jgi:ribonuclease BN (tRNA processing enzyme)